MSEERCEVHIRLDQDVVQRLLYEKSNRQRQERTGAMMARIIEELVRKHLPPAPDGFHPSDPHFGDKVYHVSLKPGDDPEAALAELFEQALEDDDDQDTDIRDPRSN